MVDALALRDDEGRLNCDKLQIINLFANFRMGELAEYLDSFSLILKVTCRTETSK